MKTYINARKEDLELYAKDYIEIIGDFPSAPYELETAKIECWTGLEEVPFRKRADTIIPPSRIK